MGVRQAEPEFGDGRVVVGQLLVDRHRFAILDVCFRRPACSQKHVADAVDRVRQVALSFLRAPGGPGQRFLSVRAWRSTSRPSSA